MGSGHPVRDGQGSFEAMSTDELVRMRADLNVSLALCAPGSAVAVPAERQLRAIAFALAAREREDTPGPGSFPGRGGTGA